MKFVFLMTALAIAAPAAERGLISSSRALPPQELAVTSNLTDQEVEPTFALTFTLSRTLPATEWQLAVLIGQTDISNLLTPTGNSLSYLPRILLLPAGASTVRVFLVKPSNEWREITQLALRVKAPAPADAAQGQTGVQAQKPAPDSAQTAAVRKYGLTPSLTLGMKSQMAERHFPESNRPGRLMFTDLTLQASLKSEITNRWFSNQAQFDLVGSSFRNEALRFAILGVGAPQVDLSSYHMEFQLNQLNSAKFQVGHTTFGTNRHLINGYGSRGITFSMPLGKRSDLSLTALNGTSIVGWNNFFGLDRRKHQIVSATLGFELLDKRPGGLRLEAGALHGSLQPIAGFNQAVINDAEQSKGASLRLVATDKAQRLKLEGGFTRSLFNNPADPLLNQNLPVVPVRETTRNAYYLNTSYALIQNRKLSEKTANLNINYRLEKVDPLFRSVAATTQADRFQQEVEITGAINEITATVSHQRFHDNLDDIPTLLKTLSRRYAVIVSVPLASLWADGTNGTDGTLGRSIWLPRLGYNMNRIHQFGRAFPANAGFDSPSQVPDQISVNHDFSSEWQLQKWRLTYRFNHSFQNNRQPGRDFADLLNQIHGVILGLNQHTAFDLNFDLNVESAKNFEKSRTDRTLRAGVNTNWRMTPRMTINATVSNTLAGDLARITRSRNTEFDLQWSYQFTRGETGWRKVKGQFFIRYADRYARMRDFVFSLVEAPQRRGERGGLAEKNRKTLFPSMRFLRVLRASAVKNQKTLFLSLRFLRVLRASAAPRHCFPTYEICRNTPWNFCFILLFLFAPDVIAQTIKVNPTGVNVNTSGATTVFLTFGPVGNFRPAEGTWCGELIPAAPNNGFRCDPATIFGSLPGRFNLSKSSGNLGFTDIMSIPPSVARRAYQAAQAGSVPSFFYVRHFINSAGGPDEYVPVTCRLSGGGARTPFALTDVKVSFDTEAAENAIVFVAPGQKPPAIKAQIAYTGTGRLRGRWEVVLPGEQPPEDFDLLTEASLPIEQRARQRRYTQLSRFNLFLPPTGKRTLAGPDVLPATLEGPYLVLLRIEATDDKEADSDLSSLGVGAGLRA